MLDEEKVDACVSVMPIDRIVDTSIYLLERRIPCVIEKPLGTSIQEAERLSRTTRETRTLHMVSVNRRFMPYLNQVRSWVDKVGPIRYICAAQVRHARTEKDFIWSTGIHVLDALRHLIGEVERFEVDIQEPKNGSVWYEISLRFQSGAVGRIEILPTAGMIEESYEFFGEGYRARVTAGSGTQRTLQCWQNNQLITDCKAGDDEPEDLLNGSYREVEEFVRAVSTGTRAYPEVDDVLPSARICFAIADLVGRSEDRSVANP
jgi:predicted dehydrogenase